MASTTAPAVDPRLPRAAAVADGMDVGESSRQGDNHPFAGDGGDASASASASASKRKTRTLAQQVKALDVYEDAVQEPLLECSNLAGMYYTAQEIGSTRPDAKVLREDFCSSAIVAQTWLELDADNRAQGVDIDLDALKVARQRLMLAKRAERRAAIVQSAAYSSTGAAHRLAHDDTDLSDAMQAATLDDPSAEQEHREPAGLQSVSTWAEGAASDRFERKFQARLAKVRARKSQSSHQAETDGTRADADGEQLLLVHADVNSLPLDDIDVEAPDLVYSGNYALSYFHDRRSLLTYLSQCRRTLRKGTGVLIVDPFAGPTSWEATTPAERQEQDDVWERFCKEPGFLRSQDGVDPPAGLKGHPLEFWQPSSHVTEAVQAHDSADWRNWPRGRLVLVRKGRVSDGSGGVEEYEYWREDGPLDHATNRFRMSLSFRFTRDGSWLRDYFSYDFRVWSLKEITEAMEEVGFVRVAVHAIPRTIEADLRANGKDGGSSSSSSSSSESDAGDNGGGDEGSDAGVGLEGMASLMRRTEQHEAHKSTYQVLQGGQKLFASKSFGTYVIACMPPDRS